MILVSARVAALVTRLMQAEDTTQQLFVKKSFRIPRQTGETMQLLILANRGHTHLAAPHQAKQGGSQTGSPLDTRVLSAPKWGTQHVPGLQSVHIRGQKRTWLATSKLLTQIHTYELSVCMSDVRNCTCLAVKIWPHETNSQAFSTDLWYVETEAPEHGPDHFNKRHESFTHTRISVI